MKLPILLFSGLLLFSSVLEAQPGNNPIAKAKPKGPRSQTYGDLNLALGIPMYSFAETSTSTPFGLTFNVLHQPQVRVPILVGGGFSYLHAGGNRVNRNLTADITAGGILIDQLNIPLEFRMNNNILNGRFMLRFQAPGKYVKPYIDLLGGFNYLWTATSVYDRSPQRFFASDNENGLITRKTQESSFTWTAGFGVGTLIYLNSNLFLNLNASYLGGGWARYYDRNQIQNWDVQLNVGGIGANAGEGSFESNDLAINAIPKVSRTDMIAAQIGIGWVFGKTQRSNNSNSNINRGNNNRQNNNRTVRPPSSQPAPFRQPTPSRRR